ncbi:MULTISPECIES: DsbA family oxidoreductase [unclassified Streptomyces]|uniref:DsbA family oxidoreductase n=1 Tax=unclassified Streptomyces TaxID=2593676 RepID=UPI00344F7077
MRVEIWSDISCPWCYVGKARFAQGLAAFAHAGEVEVVHRSYELDPHRPHGDSALMVDVLAREFGHTLDQAHAFQDRVSASARAEGLEYRTDVATHGNTFDIHRLLHHAKAWGRQDALLTLVYRADFAEERSVFDPEVLVALALEAGLDEGEVRGVLADPAAHAEDVRADERQAAEVGVRGVPFFVIDRRYGTSGAQHADTFTHTLEQAWASRPLTSFGATEAATCGPDGTCSSPS